MKDIKKDPFEEYIKNLPPTRREMGEAWSAAIGLQDVDGLKPSEYLYETAKKNIDGEITIDEVDELINIYYETKEGRAEHGTEEADKVSVRIARLFSDRAFVFSPTQYISIHKELFKGIYSHAGKIRDYNITKKEWVLEGDTVSYGSALNLRETMDYDFSQERAFKYSGLTMAETVQHLAFFVARLWQIHIFGDDGVIIRTSQLRQAKSRLALICPNFLSQMGHEVGRRRKISYLRTEVGWECAAA